MDLPETVQSTLDGESVAASVGLGGEDRLLVTPTRTLVYRAEGLLSDEAVEEYPHDAERVGIDRGRRKSKITLDYGLDGERTFTVPTKTLDSVLHPVLAGVLNAAGITDPGETIKQTFRFSDLTVVVTSARLVRHIGGAVWDEEYDEYHFDDVTDLDFEEGSVATSVVITVGGRQERFKAPNDSARALRESLVEAVCTHHGVDDVDALRAATTPDEADDSDDAAEPGADDRVSFGEGPEPLGAGNPTVDDGGNGSTATESGADPDDSEGSAGPPTAGRGPVADGEAVDGEERRSAAGDTDDTGFGDSGFESATAVDDPAVARELADLRSAVEEQNERLDRQQRTIERLIEELRQGR